MAVILLQLLFQQIKQGKGIGSRSGKTGDNLVVIESAHLAGLVFDHGLTKRHLAITGNDHIALMADGENGCGAYDWCFFHFHFFPFSS